MHTGSGLQHPKQCQQASQNMTHLLCAQLGDDVVDGHDAEVGKGGGKGAELAAHAANGGGRVRVGRLLQQLQQPIPPRTLMCAACMQPPCVSLLCSPALHATHELCIICVVLMHCQQGLRGPCEAASVSAWQSRGATE